MVAVAVAVADAVAAAATRAAESAGLPGCGAPGYSLFPGVLDPGVFGVGG